MHNNGDRRLELEVGDAKETTRSSSAAISDLPTPNSQTNSQLLSPNSEQRLWLAARTNIPGYVFVPELVSASVMKTLGTTNILSGTFVRNNDETNDQRLKTKDSEVLGPWSLVPGPARVTVFLASWTRKGKKGLDVLQHTPGACWAGTSWKPINLGLPLHRRADFQTSHIRSQRGQLCQLLSVEI